MHKIVACGGYSILDEENENITKHIFSLVDTDKPHVVFLPTASFDIEDSMDEIGKRYGEYGCTFEPLYLTNEKLTESDIERAILSADIIFVGGGNIAFLMDTWKKSKADIYLRQAYEKGIVLCGSSAGAMCWFARGYDDCGKDHEFVFIDCMGFLPYCNCPHFEDESWHKNFSRDVSKQNLSAIAVDNDTALSYVDGRYSVVKCVDEKSAYLFDAGKDFKKSGME